MSTVLKLSFSPRVRSNGTDVEFRGCSAATEKHCESLDIEAVERRNCKEDHQCTNLDRMFKCEDGLCYNISSVYSCSFHDDDADSPVSCGNKRNCVELTGMFHCTSGMCRRVHKWSCERSCTEIPIVDRHGTDLHDRILFVQTYVLNFSES